MEVIFLFACLTALSIFLCVIFVPKFYYELNQNKAILRFFLIGYSLILLITTPMIINWYWRLHNMNSQTIVFAQSTKNAIQMIFYPTKSGIYDIHLRYKNPQVEKEIHDCDMLVIKAIQNDSDAIRKKLNACKKNMNYEPMTLTINNQRFSYNFAGDILYGLGMPYVVSENGMPLKEYYAKANQPLKITFTLHTSQAQIENAKPELTIHSSFSEWFPFKSVLYFLYLPFLFSSLISIIWLKIKFSK